MSRDRLTRGLLLRAGILLTALCMCIHLYLERGQRGAAPVPSPVAAQTARERTGAAPSPLKPLGREDRTVKRRVSYVRTLKKDGLAARSGRDGGGGGDGEDEPSPPTCCPPLHPRRKSPRWHIDLEPWAGDSRSLEDEARRFLAYITTPQVPCASLSSEGPWAVCLDPKYSLMHDMDSKHCRVYSLGLGVDDRSLERSLAGSGCEVHCFDPSLKQAHQQQANMWLHRLSVDWRDPNPALAAQRQQQHATTKKLATILNDFGHRQVDVLKADMESAEWKILENLLLEGVLDSVGQLLLEVHLHWAGFEVAGDEPSVVRYWFSLLRELERANFHLFRSHSDAAKPRLFLHKNILNASSVYTLGWVNTQWRP